MEPMRKLAVLAPLLLCLAVLLGCAGGAGAERSARPAAFPRRATIDYAVDGDTLRVRLASGDLLYVRLVGIDTPEDVEPGTPVECGSRQAAASMTTLAPEGAPVRLVPDSVAGVYDRYGRLLAHAFVGGPAARAGPAPSWLGRGLPLRRPALRRSRCFRTGLRRCESRRPRGLGRVRRRLPLLELSQPPRS